MAISKEMLKKLIMRPELTSAEDMDVQPEDMKDAESFKVQEPESDEYQMDEEMPAAAQKVAQTSQKMMAAMPKKVAGESSESYQADPEIAMLLKKLKAGEPLEDSEVAQETIEDPSMDADLRRAAMQKVKQKYLGQ